MHPPHRYRTSTQSLTVVIESHRWQGVAVLLAQLHGSGSLQQPLSHTNLPAYQCTPMHQPRMPVGDRSHMRQPTETGRESFGRIDESPGTARFRIRQGANYQEYTNRMPPAWLVPRPVSTCGLASPCQHEV